MASWQIRVMGQEQIRWSHGGTVCMPDVWWPIFGSLLCAPSRTLSRRVMGGRLWPECDDQSARHRLATTLWRIRSHLPTEQRLIRIEPESISLALGSFDWVDAIVFQARAKAALQYPSLLKEERERLRLRNALDACAGPFLDGRDEDVLVIERERLRTLYLDALFALAHAEMEAGNWFGARAAAQRLCAIEPLREDAHRLLMSAHVECGSRALAISQYRTLVATLRDELGISPMQETQQLAADIGGTKSTEDAAAIPLDGNGATLREARRHLRRSLALIESVLS